MVNYLWEHQLERISTNLLTVQEVAAYLGISRRAVYGLVERGTLWSLEFKGQIFIPTPEVEVYRLNKLAQQEGYFGIMAEDTPYPGADAHYQSWAQSSDASFKPFHDPFITYINELLLEQLPPGYKSFTGDTVTIRKFIDGAPLGRGRTRYPDVSIRSTGETGRHTALASGGAPGLSVQLVTPPRPPKTDLAIVIAKEPAEAQVKPDPQTGRYIEPITVIEILSPANKTTDAREYQQRRYDYWASGLNLLEIDLLHETPPVFEDSQYLLYPQPGSKAYYIAISQPHQDTQVIAFGVSQPMPIVSIPLSNADTLPFDFNAAYRMTFRKTRAGDEVDYVQLPYGFQRYSEEDQQFIRQKMQEIQQGSHIQLNKPTDPDNNG